MRRAVFTYLVLVTMTFFLVNTPVAANCLSAKFKKDAGVCKITGQKECHHKACPMKTEARSHHHEGPSEQTCKTFIKCAGNGQEALNQAFFDDTVFLLPDTSPLRVQDGVSSVTECINPSLKDPSSPVEIPPKI